jgi:predicted TIM-barrel fold metal-dependent hydrolase
MLKFFDCNCMIGRVGNKSLPFHGAGELREEMKYYNIEKALVFHSLAWQTDPMYGNELLLKEIKGMDNLYPVAVAGAWETSRKAVSDELLKFAGEKAYGIKLFPATHEYELCDENLGELMKLADRAHLPVIMDYEQMKGVGGLKELLAAYPGVTFILSDLGYGFNKIIYPMLGRYGNFCIEISLYRTYLGIEEIVENYGAERVLFGSYMPLHDAGAAECRIIYSGLKEEDKEKIAHGNMERIISRVRR